MPDLKQGRYNICTSQRDRNGVHWYTPETRWAMSTYGQFCPVAKAMELLDERWTLLVVRELLQGSAHFNDLRRGVPRMSPALLSKRLKSLARAGVVQRSEVDGRACYSLTECGKELSGVVDALGAWGVRWVGEIGDDDLDPTC